MVRCLIITTACLIFATSVLAGETGTVSSGTSLINEFLEDINHQHHLDSDEAGIGADVVIYQTAGAYNLIEEVTVEYRRDFDNDADKVYGVVRVNLWQKIKKLFN